MLVPNTGGAQLEKALLNLSPLASTMDFEDPSPSSGTISRKAEPAASALNIESVGGSFSTPADTTTVGDAEVRDHLPFPPNSSLTFVAASEHIHCCPAWRRRTYPGAH